MFHPGRAPKKNKRARAVRKGKFIPINSKEDIDNSTCQFEINPTHWLILPKKDTLVFERQLFCRESSYAFSSSYLQSISFKRIYPEQSLAYIVAKAAFPTTLSHSEIEKHVQDTFMKNNRVRLCMKRIVNAWKKKHMCIVNDADIVTQEKPKKPVYLVDWPSKIIHQFEASTLLKDSTIRLMNHDVMILEPLSPRNPFTNNDLTYSACLSLHKQIRAAGITNWIWEAFAESEFNLVKLVRTFEVPMKLNCLDLVLKESTSYYTIEFIMDFILGEYTYHAIINPPTETEITRLITLNWETPVIQSWISLCRVFWRAHIKHSQEEIMYTHIKSKELIRKLKMFRITILNSMNNIVNVVTLI